MGNEGFRCRVSALPLAANVQSNRERNSEKANNEYRTRNNEYRSKVFYHLLFLIKTERSGIHKYSIFNLQFSMPACPV